eukprot:CAMPEP_0119091222 /NCGR_PEP_ID=MMETSP1178-20130426/155578_1 /TAXON_ID=33656 /ORGANISM="unid sp, Strain CCMP2000" /LENGTH=181 /DNA_ID=CAMNT_0007074705 /DNA_START=28 /DNA_END=570 /DNA_ORIENTATION=+
MAAFSASLAAFCSPLRPVYCPTGVITFEGTARPMTANTIWPKTTPLLSSRERTPDVIMRIVGPENVRHYAVLGVKPGASMNELKRAYRERAKQCHPDLNPTSAAAQEFRRLTEAFERLTDAKTPLGLTPIPNRRPNGTPSPAAQVVAKARAAAERAAAASPEEQVNGVARAAAARKAAEQE